MVEDFTMPSWKENPEINVSSPVQQTSGPSASEVTVTIKNDEGKTLKEKFLIYDPYQVCEDDPIIRDCIARTLKDFMDDPSDIKVKISMTVL